MPQFDETLQVVTQLSYSAKPNQKALKNNKRKLQLKNEFKLLIYFSLKAFLCNFAIHRNLETRFGFNSVVKAEVTKACPLHSLLCTIAKGNSVFLTDQPQMLQTTMSDSSDRSQNLLGLIEAVSRVR